MIEPQRIERIIAHRPRCFRSEAAIPSGSPDVIPDLGFHHSFDFLPAQPAISDQFAPGQLAGVTYRNPEQAEAGGVVRNAVRNPLLDFRSRVRARIPNHCFAIAIDGEEGVQIILRQLAQDQAWGFEPNHAYTFAQIA